MFILKDGDIRLKDVRSPLGQIPWWSLLEVRTQRVRPDGDEN